MGSMADEGLPKGINWRKGESCTDGFVKNVLCTRDRKKSENC